MEEKLEGAASRLNGVFRLICVDCGSRLNQGARGLHCGACNAQYPERNGTVDFVYPYVGRSDLDREVVEIITDAVMTTHAFPSSARKLVEGAVVDTGLRTGISYIDAEISGIASRFGIEVQELSLTEGGASKGVIKFEFSRHYVEPNLPANSRLLRTVRLRNSSEFRVQSDGAQAVKLSYHWLDRHGNVLIHEGVRTDLPVPVDAGREMSIVMTIDTPLEVGPYILRILAVEEGVHWCEENVLDIPINLLPYIENEFHNLTINSNINSYAEDHLVGTKFVERYIAATSFGPGRKFLEVAAGVHPHISSFASENIVVSSDICSNLCQIGRLYYNIVDHRNFDRNLHFVSFDVSKPPFERGQFDAVVLFAALHHFPEPEAFLKLLVHMLKPGGFIAVLCEPWGPDPTCELYRRDLAQGINEQWFTLEEYNGIFAAAGLQSVRTQLDGASLKVILKPRVGASLFGIIPSCLEGVGYKAAKICAKWVCEIRRKVICWMNMALSCYGRSSHEIRPVSNRSHG